jgi:hypothetical protein
MVIMCKGGKKEVFFLCVIVFSIESKGIDHVLEDMMRANSISQFPKMLKNDKNVINVRKISLGVAPRKQGWKVESKPPNAPSKK